MRRVGECVEGGVVGGRGGGTVCRGWVVRARWSEWEVCATSLFYLCLPIVVCGVSLSAPCHCAVSRAGWHPPSAPATATARVILAKVRAPAPPTAPQNVGTDFVTDCE